MVRQRKRSLTLLILALFSLITMLLLVGFFPPTHEFPLFTLQIPILYIFFITLFLCCFSATSYFFKSKVHGILLGLFLVSILVFRLNNLTHPFFFILLAGLFLTLELLFTYRK